MWVQEFVSEFKRSTVTAPRTEKAQSLKEINLPKCLYKYRTVNTHSLTNLQNDTIWICSPEEYNDPYDCLFKISESDVVAAAHKNLLPDFIKLFKLDRYVPRDLVKSARLSSDPIKSVIDGLPSGLEFPSNADPVKMQQFTSMQIPKIVKDMIEFVHSIRNAIKICSFSELNNSILMWSHYANYHKGFCVEYDIQKLPPSHALRRNMYPVVYSAKLFDLTRWSEKLVRTGGKEFNPVLAILAMMRKYKDWRYEREWRFILVEPRKASDRAMEVPRPSKIFLGSRINDTDRAKLIDICVEKGIEVWVMEKIRGAFELKATQLVCPYKS